MKDHKLLDLGTKLVDMRKVLGKTQADMAKHMGIRERSYQRIETRESLHVPRGFEQIASQSAIDANWFFKSDLSFTRHHEEYLLLRCRVAGDLSAPYHPKAFKTEYGILADPERHVTRRFLAALRVAFITRFSTLASVWFSIACGLFYFSLFYILLRFIPEGYWYSPFQVQSDLVLALGQTMLSIPLERIHDLLFCLCLYIQAHLLAYMIYVQITAVRRAKRLMTNDALRMKVLSE